MARSELSSLVVSGSVVWSKSKRKKGKQPQVPTKVVKKADVKK